MIRPLTRPEINRASIKSNANGSSKLSRYELEWTRFRLLFIDRVTDRSNEFRVHVLLDVEEKRKVLRSLPRRLFSACSRESHTKRGDVIGRTTLTLRPRRS